MHMFDNPIRTVPLLHRYIKRITNKSSVDTERRTKKELKNIERAL